MANHGNMYGPAFTFLGIPRCDLDKPDSYKGADGGEGLDLVGGELGEGLAAVDGADEEDVLAEGREEVQEAHVVGDLSHIYSRGLV